MSSSVDDKPFAPPISCDEVVGEVHCALPHGHLGAHAYDEGTSYYADGYTVMQFTSLMWSKGRRPTKE